MQSDEMHVPVGYERHPRRVSDVFQQSPCHKEEENDGDKGENSPDAAQNAVRQEALQPGGIEADQVLHPLDQAHLEEMLQGDTYAVDREEDEAHHTQQNHQTQYLVGGGSIQPLGE